MVCVCARRDLPSGPRQTGPGPVSALQMFSHSHSHTQPLAARRPCRGCRPSHLCSTDTDRHKDGSQEDSSQSLFNVLLRWSQLVWEAYEGKLSRGGTWQDRWKTFGQRSQHSSSPPIRHTAQKSSLSISASSDSSGPLGETGFATRSGL